MIKKVTVLFFVLVSIPSFSQNIDLTLLDINKVSNSNPKDFVIVGNVFYFIASGLDTGYELWRSDGTDFGTYIVKDINPGYKNAFVDETSSNLTNINGVLYFSADDGINGFELWKSDGSEAGTVMVKNIAGGVSNSSPYGFTSINSEIVFGCDDGVNGVELWKTDGTNSGTVLLKNISSGSSSTPKNFIFFNNKIYFDAYNESFGNEIWMTDGTSANTILQNDLLPGDVSGVNNLTGMLLFNNELYFRGRDGSSGFELWKTNGIVGNSTLVMDVWSGSNDGFAGKILTANSTMIFFDGKTNLSGKEIWKSNGNSSGTAIVKDVYSGYEDGIDYSMNYAFIGQTLYFSGKNNIGNGIWKTNGTSLGTTLVKIITTGSQSAYIFYMSSIDGSLYFSARQEVNGNKDYLWKSDGTTLGTQLIKDVYLRGMDGGSKNKIFKCNNAIFFAGNSAKNGWELWKTDGTTIGTNLFKDINYQAGSFPQDLIELNGEVIYSAQSELGTELYKSNGTELGTILVKDVSTDLNGGGGLFDFNNYNKSVKVGNQIFFSAIATNGSGGDRELWKTDGTEAGTVLIKDIGGVGISGLDENFGHDYAVLNNSLFFLADDGINGHELWKSDGTSAGTYMVKDLTPGSADSYINTMCVFNNKVFFVSKSGKEIWYTDGTDAGTQFFYSANNIRYLKVIGNKLFFGANQISSTYGPNSLYVTDTNLSVPQLLGTWLGAGIGPVTVFNNEYYFVTATSFGRSVFKSNGTVSGTVAVKQNFGLPEIKQLKVCGNNLYFTNDPSLDGANQLWRTDGTETGTIQLGVTAQYDYHFKCLTCFQNQLFYFFDYTTPYYITGLLDSYYRNIWKTDGVSVTNYPLSVLNSQGFLNKYGYGAIDMFSTDSKMYFIANNGYSGIELYASDLQSILSLNENDSNSITSNESPIIAYPNPTNSILNLKSKILIKKVIVFDSLGKKVFETNIDSQEGLINLSSLDSGLYLLKILSDDSTYYKKIIKK